MKCDKCGHENSKYNIVCEECQTPLNIESNDFLKEKYNEKGLHIDIEEASERSSQPDFDGTRKNVSKAILGAIIVAILALFFLVYSFFVDNQSQRLVDQYKKLKDDSPLLLIYFGKDDKIIDLCDTYSKNYDFDFLNINQSKLTYAKRKHIRKDLNIDSLNNSLVFIKKGVLITITTDITTTDQVIEFLHTNNFIPQTYANTEPILASLKQAFEAENKTIVYLETKESGDLEARSEVFEKLSKEYSFTYKEIKGFLLSKKQLLKVMSQLGFSEIQNNLIIYIENGKIVKVLEDIEHKEEYFYLLSSYGIIDTSSEKYLKNITFSEFEKKVKEKTKSVIVIGSDACNSCDKLDPILREITTNHKIEIFYLKTGDNTDKISNIIKGLGNQEGLTNLPFILIVEKEQLIDYMVGFVDKQLLTEKLMENGVIR